MKTKKKKKHPITTHFKKMGFTNRLAIYLVIFLAVGLVMGYLLASKSIEYQYTGALACFTIVFTPIGTAVSIVLSKVVDKNKAENTSADGNGITYAAAEAKGFIQEDDMYNYCCDDTDINNPSI